MASPSSEADTSTKTVHLLAEVCTAKTAAEGRRIPSSAHSASHGSHSAETVRHSPNETAAQTAAANYGTLRRAAPASSPTISTKQTIAVSTATTTKAFTASTKRALASLTKPVVITERRKKALPKTRRPKNEPTPYKHAKPPKIAKAAVPAASSADCRGHGIRDTLRSTVDR